MRLAELVAAQRVPRTFDPRRYISLWTEKDLLDGKVVDALVVIFRTRGCYWARKSGCSMCGYVNDVAGEVGEADLRHQLDRVLESYADQPFVKIYTSGNFFDPYEVPPPVRRAILKAFGERADKVLVETLAHLVRREDLEEAVGLCPRLEIALGLESADDDVLRHAVNKYWGLKDHARAYALAHEAGATVKTYLLIKPPFLTERGAIEDAVASGHLADPYSDTISFNPLNVPRNTLVEALWRRGEYRPPWLWSVVEVLRRCTDLQAQVKCHPTGGGKRRGAHNCGRCDRAVLEAIEARSLNLRDDLDGLACDCEDAWRDEVALGPRLRTSADLRRLLA
jgi:radical SAM enzyme (TIGR01210 family)